MSHAGYMPFIPHHMAEGDPGRQITSLLILHPKTAGGYRQRSEFRSNCLLDRSEWRKFVVACSAAE